MFYHDYLRSPMWAHRRLIELNRAGWRCEDCAHTDHLEVHHNNYLRVGRERDGDLRVLCADCHGRIVHRRRFQQAPIESIDSILPRVVRATLAPTLRTRPLVAKD